jgi:hypothetical protein
VRQKVIIKSVLILLLMCGLALQLSAAAVQAAFVTIDTNNNIIDPAWSSVPVFRQKAKTPAILDGYNIKQVWVAREADSSFYYFRADLYGQLPTDNYSSIEARIDCDGDNSFSGSLDKIVFYYHSASVNTLDNVIECAGSDYPLCSTDGESKGWDFGEEISAGGGVYAYEWKADTNDPGGIDWSTCSKQKAIQFVTVDNLGVVVDSTAPAVFDGPTAAYFPIVQK